jgi:transcriptional regulator with XRE-family HTH domain
MGTVDLNTRLGRNLRRLRLASGLSQEVLADQCCLHRTYIGAVERGERNVTLQTVEKIAAALKVDPLDLLRDPPQ